MEKLIKIKTFIGKYVIPSVSMLLMVGVVYVSISRLQRPVTINKEQAAETGVSLNISPAVVTIAPGESFDVAFTIDTQAETISAAELSVNFDSNILIANTITLGDFLPKVLKPGSIKTDLSVLF